MQDVIKAEIIPHFFENSFPTKYITGIARTPTKTEVNLKIKSEHPVNGFKNK